MHRSFVSLSLTLYALFCLSCPAAHAQTTPGLYLGPGRVLQAGAPRQLSLNAHVTGFLFQPGGLSVAFVGTHDEDGQRTVMVRFADARHERTAQVLYRATGDSPDAHVAEPHIPGIDLLGWTPDGRRLLLREADQITLQSHYVSVDVGREPFRIHTLPDPPTPGDGTALSDKHVVVPATAWSPDGRHLLITADGTVQDSQGEDASVTTAEIYDPIRDETFPVLVPEGFLIWGWLDAGHLLFLRPTHTHGGKTAFLVHDLAAATDAEIPRPTPWPPAGVEVSFTLSAQNADPTTPAAPGLVLETKREGLSDTQKVATTQATSLWVRRTRAPKALSAIAVGVTPGADDPQAAWSPSGRAVAFVAHEDLFVADLTERDATPVEKVAAGEKLSCDEERRIIESNMKQVGLGILQYNEDNDEKFPPAGGWHDAVFPYVKNEQMFNFAGVPVVYHSPPGMTLASIEVPMTTVLATADTPCAHVVLYADGHVKSYDKQGNLLPAPERAP